MSDRGNGSAYEDRLPSDFPNELLESAISLEAEGLSELAWTRNDALCVIKELTERGYAILGGDVLRKEYGRVTHTYDSWFTNKDSRIPWEQLVLKSRDEATSYINRYSQDNKEDFYYVIVFEALDEANS